MSDLHFRVLLADNEGFEVILQRMDLFNGENNNKEIHFEIFIKMYNLDQVFLISIRVFTFRKHVSRLIKD